VTLELRLWFAASLCLVAFCVLGYAVTHAPSLWRIDVEEAAAVHGQATPLAVLFTGTGRALPLFILAVIGILATAATHANVRIAIAIFVAQLISQGLVEGFKHIFSRVRPDAWLIHRDFGFSYPSGHACTAIVFFGSWFIFVMYSPMPKALKLGLLIVLAAWVVGIDWSRMALGAHYPTDVLGGTLIGIATACALWALLLHFRIASPFAAPA
jgi:undecaprenyl-diphosphatase